MSMSYPPIYALLGGSFDPVHRGHLMMAQAVATRLNMVNATHRTALLPSRNPFKHHRHTTDDERLAMLQLAVGNINQTHHAKLDIDTSELDSPSNKPTYTQDTLIRLKQQHPDTTLIFIIGQDSLNTLPTWKGGLDLLALTHFWVFARPPFVTTWDYSPFVADLNTLLSQPCGNIYLDNTPIPTISSTAIRQKLAQGKPSPELPPCVQDHISQNRLYLL